MTNPFLDTMKREIKRIKENPIILIVLIAIPLFTCFLLWSTFKYGTPRNLPIGVLDEDNSNLSRQIIRLIDSTPSCEVKYKVTDINQGKQFIVEGKTYGLVVIPRDFKRDLLREVRPQLVYYYNNQMLLVGGIITKDVTTTIQTVMGHITAYIYASKGIPLDIIKSQVNVIKIDERVRSNPYLNYSYFLSTAAFIHTFQVIIAFLAIWAIGSEFKEGTTKEWLECAGNSVLISVFAKFLPYIISFLGIIFFVYWLYFGLYGAPFGGNIYFSIFATLLFILAYQMIGMAFVATTGNLRLSFSSGAFYTSLGFTLEGMTYPSIAMPTFGRWYSALLPLRPYLAIMVDQSQRDFPIIYDMGYIAWLIALALVGAIFLPLLKVRMQDETQWYKV